MLHTGPPCAKPPCSNARLMKRRSTVPSEYRKGPRLDLSSSLKATMAPEMPWQAFDGSQCKFAAISAVAAVVASGCQDPRLVKQSRETADLGRRSTEAASQPRSARIPRRSEIICA
eukprot:365048-Chlamydomonas_euryale.AAC.25